MKNIFFLLNINNHLLLIIYLFVFQLGQSALWDWFLTFVSSVLQNSFLISPIRLFVTATILSQIRQRRKFEVADWIGLQGNWGRQKGIAEWRCRQTQHAYEMFQLEKQPLRSRFALKNLRRAAIQKQPWCYQLPNFNALYRAGKLKIAVTQVKRFWVEALTWVFLTALLSAILFLQQDSNFHHLNLLYKSRFVKDLEKIEKLTDYFDYMENYFIPRVFRVTADTINSTSYLLGAIRVRQARLNQNHCPPKIPSPLQQRYCVPGEQSVISLYQFDTADYFPFWVKLNRTDIFNFEYENELMYEITTPWTYSSLYKTFSSVPLLGNNLKRIHYPLGGYVVDLKFGREIILSTLNGLKVAKWVDDKTSAIFTEVAFFLPDSQHVTSLFLGAESLSYGKVSISFEILSYKQPYFYNFSDLILAGIQLAHFLLELLLIYDFVSQFREVKWQRKGIVQVLFNGWSILAVINIMLSLIAYTFYVCFIYYSVVIIKHYQQDTGKFTSFATPARFQHYYSTSLALASFVSFIRTLKVFRCSSTVTVMIDAIEFARLDLINITVVVFLILVAFCSFWNLSFGYTRFNFHGFLTTFLSVTALMLGIEPNASHGEPINSPLYGISVCIFMFIAIAFLSNMYTAAIESGFKKMRVHLNERSRDPVETLAVVWLYDKVLSALGFNKVKLMLKVSE